MAMHILKTWPAFWSALAAGTKTFEVRRNDRDFKVGDTLMLKEYDYELSAFTGREIARKVTYVMEGGKFGVDPKFCVMGLRD